MKIFGFEVEESSMPDLKQFMGIEDFKKDAETLTKGLPHNEGWKDRRDAARHVLGVGELARKTNPTIANILANTYEFIMGNEPGEDADMDAHNNEVALQLFNAKDYAEVKTRVKKLMDNIQYKDTSDKTKPVFMELGRTTK